MPSREPEPRRLSQFLRHPATIGTTAVALGLAAVLSGRPGDPTNVPPPPSGTVRPAPSGDIPIPTIAPTLNRQAIPTAPRPTEKPNTPTGFSTADNIALRRAVIDVNASTQDKQAESSLWKGIYGFWNRLHPGQTLSEIADERISSLPNDLRLSKNTAFRKAIATLDTHSVQLTSVEKMEDNNTKFGAILATTIDKNNRLLLGVLVSREAVSKNEFGNPLVLTLALVYQAKQIELLMQDPTINNARSPQEKEGLIHAAIANNPEIHAKSQFTTAEALVKHIALFEETGFGSEYQRIYGNLMRSYLVCGKTYDTCFRDTLNELEKIPSQPIPRRQLA